MKKSILLSALTLLLIGSLNAQKMLTLYHLQNNALVNLVNPGNTENSKLFLSLPTGMQGFGIANTGFVLNDARVQRADDSLEFNPFLAINKMAKTNYIQFEGFNQLFGLGFKIGKNYFTIGVNARYAFRFTYPKDLIQFAWEGNANRLNERIAMDGLRIDALAYSEYAVGINRPLTEKIQFGARVKFLSGIANVNTHKSKLGLTTDAENFGLTLDGEAEIRSSNISQFYDSTVATSDAIKDVSIAAFNFKNSGFAIDAGFTYKLSEKIKLHGSLLDMGFIRWNSNVSNYSTKDFKYTFNGINFNQSLNDSINVGKSFQDTIQKIFGQKETKEAYITSLATRFYLGGTFQLNKIFGFSGVLYSEIYGKKYSPTLSLGTTIKLRKWFSGVIQYGITNRSVNNVGAGFIIKAGPSQFSIMSDNILAFMYPTKVKYTNVIFGMTFSIPSKEKLKPEAVK